MKIERDEVLVAVEDEARGFVGAFGIDDAAELDALFAGVAGLRLVLLLVGDDADGKAADARVAAEDGAAVVGLVLVELGAIDETRDDFMHVVGVAGGACGIGIDEGVEIFGGILRRVLLRVEGGAIEGGAGGMAELADERT